MICLRCICVRKYKKGTKIPIDKIIQYIASSSPRKIIFLSTISILAATIDDFISFFDKRSHLEMKTLDTILKTVI